MLGLHCCGCTSFCSLQSQMSLSFCCSLDSSLLFLGSMPICTCFLHLPVTCLVLKGVSVIQQVSSTLLYVKQKSPAFNLSWLQTEKWLGTHPPFSLPPLWALALVETWPNSPYFWLLVPSMCLQKQINWDMLQVKTVLEKHHLAISVMLSLQGQYWKHNNQVQ